MRDGSTGRTSEIENFFAGSDVDVIDTTKNTSGNLRSERIPNTVFGLGSIAILNRNAFFAVNRFTGDQILSDEKILFAASNKDTFVTMGFYDNLGSSLGSASRTTSSTSTSRASASSRGS